MSIGCDCKINCCTSTLLYSWGFILKYFANRTAFVKINHKCLDSDVQRIQQSRANHENKIMNFLPKHHFMSTTNK